MLCPIGVWYTLYIRNRPLPPLGTSPNLGEESKRNLYSEGRSYMGASPTSPPYSVFRFHLSVFRATGAGSLHQFSLYEYAHITAGIVGEDGNGFAEVA